MRRTALTVAAVVAALTLLGGCGAFDHTYQERVEAVGDMASDLRADIDEIAAQVETPENREQIEKLTRQYDELMANVAPILADAQNGDMTRAGAGLGEFVGGVFGVGGIGAALGGLVGGGWQRLRAAGILGDYARAMNRAKRKNPNLASSLSESSDTLNAGMSSSTRRAIDKARKKLHEPRVAA